MLKATVHISETIRCVVRDIPKTVFLENMQPLTVRQICKHVGIPPILIVFAMVNGDKRDLDDLIGGDVEMYLVGTMAGG